MNFSTSPPNKAFTSSCFISLNAFSGLNSSFLDRFIGYKVLSFPHMEIHTYGTSNANSSTVHIRIVCCVALVDPFRVHWSVQGGTRLSDASAMFNEHLHWHGNTISTITSPPVKLACKVFQGCEEK